MNSISPRIAPRNTSRLALRRIVALTLACGVGQAFAAGGDVTGVLAAPAAVQPGDSSTVTITVTGGSFGIDCMAGYNVRDAANAVVKSANNLKMQSPGKSVTRNVSISLPQPGVYTIEALSGAPNSQTVNCLGNVQTKLTVNAPARAAAPVFNPGLSLAKAECDALYDDKPADKAAGELACEKKLAGCPENFTGAVDAANGKLTCTPKPAACPPGWEGGMQGGLLVCNSAPQPQVKCPAKTATWQWGTTYYKTGWRAYGCYKNSEPAK